MKEVKKEKKNENKKGLKITLIVVGVIVLAVLCFLLYWFTRKFDVTIKYNNGLDDTVSKVTYLSYFDESVLPVKLEKNGYSFGGYHEVYYITDEDVESLKDSNGTILSLCEVGYIINNERTKCVKEEEFDFKNTKIKEDTNIEVLWTKKSEAKETKKEEKKENDTGKVKLTLSKSCAIGGDTVKVTASISGKTSNKTLTWSLPKCYKATKVSNTVYKLKRNSKCKDTESLKSTISASLKNGSKSSVNVNYEPKLVVKVYNNGSQISLDNGAYWGNRIIIKTNVNATFKGSSSYYNSIASTTKNTATLRDTSGDTITVKTSCGQKKSIKITPIIN